MSFCQRLLAPLAALICGLLLSIHAYGQRNFDGREWNQFVCTGKSLASAGPNPLDKSDTATMRFSYQKNMDRVLIKGWDRFTGHGSYISPENNAYGPNVVQRSSRGVHASFKHGSGGLPYEIKFDAAKSIASASYLTNSMRSIFVGTCSRSKWMD